MTTMIPRRAFSTASVLLGLLLGGIVPANAQVKCYIRKCVEYPDGTSVCERTPVDCTTIPVQ